MVYAIAAYSLTIGVLALYGLSVGHRARVAAAEWARVSAQPAAASGGGFNVGACLLAPFWLLSHGARVPGALLLLAVLALIPLGLQGLWTAFLFVAIIPVAAGAALGFVGNRIAAQHLSLTEAAALSATQLPWALAGIGLHVFALPWAIYFLMR